MQYCTVHIWIMTPPCINGGRKRGFRRIRSFLRLREGDVVWCFETGDGENHGRGGESDLSWESSNELCLPWSLPFFFFFFFFLSFLFFFLFLLPTRNSLITSLESVVVVVVVVVVSSSTLQQQLRSRARGTIDCGSPPPPHRYPVCLNLALSQERSPQFITSARSRTHVFFSSKPFGRQGRLNVGRVELPMYTPVRYSLAKSHQGKNVLVLVLGYSHKWWNICKYLC